MAETGEIAEVIGETARKKLDVDAWDRPAIYRESAESGTDNRRVYWAVLLLSGAIATLGLAMDSSAVVIGAMLVAPLLGPVLGLALALAVGDGRLSVQTSAIVLASTIGVILVAAALTAVLPFHTVTPEIVARTRPTTLDLAIAVFSGLVGAVVMVARGSRLSAAIPGVAIAVALIPPLAVAGFGLGIGRADLIRGSLLLYGANLAGIVLSGMAVFLLIGMHRPEVLHTARGHHEKAEPHGIAAWTVRLAWVRSLGVFQSAWARVALVVAFVVALGLPLSQTLTQLARETRVERAVSEAQGALYEIPGRASILGRQVVLAPDRAHVYLRVATTSWFGSAAREEFERRASAAAREPVRLPLEQLPARGEDIEQLRNLFPGQDARAPAAPAAVGLAEILASARGRVAQSMVDVALPDGVEVVETDVSTSDDGRVVLGIIYAAPEPLDTQAREMLRAQLRRGTDVPTLNLRLRHISTEPRVADDSALDDVMQLMLAHAALRLEVLAPEAAAAERALILERLGAAGIDGGRVATPAGDLAVSEVRVRVAVVRRE